MRAIYATDAEGRRLVRTAVASMGRKSGKAGNRKLSKSRSRGRIDPLIAAIMAVGQASREPEMREITFDRPLILSA